MRRLILVVSGILRVIGSSGHQPSSKDLQSKEPTVVCRPPLRCLSHTEKSGEKVRQFISRVFESLLVAIPFLFIKEKEDPLFI